MKPEEKDLLLKDICPRMPYKVRGLYKTSGIVITDQKLTYYIIGGLEYRNDIEFKPYLYPLSSMTDELWDKEFRGYGITEFTRDSFKYGCETLEFHNSSPEFSNLVKFINQLIKHHFDVNGLIPKGLAIDATNLNIYRS